MWREQFESERVQYGYAAPPSLYEAPDEDRPVAKALYHQTTDEIVLRVKGEVYDQLYDDDRLAVESPLDNPFFRYDFGHEFGHVRLSKSASIWDRMFVLNVRSVESFKQNIDDLSQQSPDEVAEELLDFLGGHVGIQVFQDAWRPVQEAYARIYSAYQFPRPTDFVLSQEVSRIESELDDSVSIELGNPPFSMITDDPDKAKKFRYKHEHVTVSAAKKIYDRANFADETQFMSFIAAIAQLASTDGLASSWKTKVGRQFLEMMIAASRQAKFMNFDTGNRNLTPTGAAEAIAKSLGYPSIENETREQSLRGTLANVFGNEPEMSPAIRERATSMWQSMIAETDPLSIIVQNADTGEYVISFREHNQAYQEFSELAAVVRVLFRACVHGLPAHIGFTDPSETEFATKEGRDHYQATVELYESLDAAGKAEWIQNEIRNRAQDTFA